MSRPGHAKIAADLGESIDGRARPSLRWSRDVGGRHHVQMIVVGDGVDPEMRALRAQVEALGGSVLVRHGAIHALTVQLPAAQVKVLAERDDVVGLSPNRTVSPVFSQLESITGTKAGSVRGTSDPGTWTGLDGAGVGIAVLDSGLMHKHSMFQDNKATGRTRIGRHVNMLNSNVANWSAGAGNLLALQPGSAAQKSYEALIANDTGSAQDLYGHGTHVASMAAGSGKLAAGGTYNGFYGIARNATLYDVKVLDADGNGTVSDAIEGIQWVIYHAKEYNIRVLNLSIAASSTETWQTDPLCMAARSAVAAGITVVVSAGNNGLNSAGKTQYGAIAAPGNDPSVITVGATNFHATDARTDDTVAGFSSRGPTRGSYVDASGKRVIDNLLKPDLVAPGNRVVGAAAWLSDRGWNALANKHSGLRYSGADAGVTGTSAAAAEGSTLMLLSGTSVSAPVVSGAVALMLQANPGLTPPLIKAMLQYSAQPVTGANLMSQGAGQLNVTGAVALARSVRTDLATAITAGKLNPGDAMLAPGMEVPTPVGLGNTGFFTWSAMVFVGGRHVMSGPALFSRYQAVWDPRLTWAGSVLRLRTPTYWAGTGFVSGFTDIPVTNRPLLTAGLIYADSMAGRSSYLGSTGVFSTGSVLSGWLGSGSGIFTNAWTVSGTGLVMSEGLVLSEGLVMSEGVRAGNGAVNPMLGEP